VILEFQSTHQFSGIVTTKVVKMFFSQAYPGGYLTNGIQVYFIFIIESKTD
jgi:hypothetical protein